MRNFYWGLDFIKQEFWIASEDKVSAFLIIKDYL
jgi:hypothetical protein